MAIIWIGMEQDPRLIQHHHPTAKLHTMTETKSIITSIIRGYILTLAPSIILALGYILLLNFSDIPDTLEDITASLTSTDPTTMVKALFSHSDSMVQNSLFAIAAFLLISVIGSIIVAIGMLHLAKHLDKTGRTAVQLMAALTLINTLLTYSVLIPDTGILNTTLIKIALAIVSFYAYSSFRKSGSLKVKGTIGANLLYSAMLLSIMATIVASFTTLASLIMTVIYWIYTFKGWSKIRASFTAASNAQ